MYLAWIIQKYTWSRRLRTRDGVFLDFSELLLKLLKCCGDIPQVKCVVCRCVGFWGGMKEGVWYKSVFYFTVLCSFQTPDSGNLSGGILHIHKCHGSHIHLLSQDVHPGPQEYVSDGASHFKGEPFPSFSQASRPNAGVDTWARKLPGDPRTLSAGGESLDRKTSWRRRRGWGLLFHYK